MPESKGLSLSRLNLKWLSAAAYSGMFCFGIVMALLGAILPLFVNRPQFDLSKAGGLFLAMNAAMLITTVFLGPALDRFGIRSTMLIAPLFVALGVVLIANAQESLLLKLGVISLGAGGGALNQATNTLIADLHGDARKKNAALNILGIFFGFGALFIPFTIGTLLPSLGMQNILYGAAVLILVPIALSAFLQFPQPRQSGPIRLADVFQFLRQPLVLAFGFLLFFESGNEFTLGGYVSSYLTRELGAPVTTASYALAGYWGAIMLTRVALGRLLLKFRGETLIRWSALGVALCLVIFRFSHASGIAAIVAFPLGIAIAAIFPTVLGLAGARYASNSGTVFGVLIGIALVGGMTMPWVTGEVSAAYSIRDALWIPAAGALAIFVLELIVEHLMKRAAAQ